MSNGSSVQFVRRFLENSILTTNLNGGAHRIINLAKIDPTPPGILGDGDPRLSDKRPVPPGSVTNDKIAFDAAITQNKVSFSGLLPTDWIGNTPGLVARGSQVQYKAQKGAANGYAPLDGNNQLPGAQFPPSVTTTGTLKKFRIAFPSEFSGTDFIETGSGTLNADWASVPPNTWLGNPTGASDRPRFRLENVPTSLVPGLSAAKFTSGVFPEERLPAAATGGSHKAGLTPAPGIDGDPDDYLGRDMEFHTMAKGTTYQPTLPDPAIVIHSYGSADSSNAANINFSSSVAASLFYRLGTSGVFSPTPPALSVIPPIKVQAYAAKTGWNNSSIVTVLVGLPPIVNTP